jgi:hypothetical protein
MSTIMSPKARKLLKTAEKRVAALKAKGWKKADFARALEKLLGGKP